MQQNIKKRLEEINRNGLHLDTGALIDQSFENYKKIALIAGLAFLIMVIIITVLLIGGVSVFYGLERYVQDFSNLEQNGISRNFIIISAIVNTVIAAITAPFSAGIIKMSSDADNNREFSVGTAFEYYKSTKFIPVFTASLIIALTSALIGAVLQLLNMNFVGTFVSMIIGFLTCLTLPLLILGNLSVKDAIVNSIALVNKAPLTVLLALIVAFIGALTGLIAFCLGVFFTLPYIYCMYYTIYRNIFGSDDSEIEDIGRSDSF
ncbi:hypothetical protein E6C50_16125 [Flavobacterium supellecticarium]|uniref:Beta-carotene 15,15'-monooxygenase n=1 Tax=Flavobacterium supellecticarium TaxID=2565924 RepID=A0A4S3ZQU4_9FLAO|nr:hypothetical protein [Flavobacterium supellecticarium]THF47959.1 hypothetical protein E6C50_16125 [Flavobacterium supellecticarium]